MRIVQNFTLSLTARETIQLFVSITIIVSVLRRRQVDDSGKMRHRNCFLQMQAVEVLKEERESYEKKKKIFRLDSDSFDCFLLCDSGLQPCFT